MASVTGRIKEIKQPRGGYIKVIAFDTIPMDDDVILNSEENISASVIGMAVDYLTRFVMGNDIKEAFKISLLGANAAELLYGKKSIAVATKLLKGIKGLDDNSIINACKLVTFDVWYRNPLVAPNSKGYSEINPDKLTIENIKTLIKRSVTFFEKYGPVLQEGFNFLPENADMSLCEKILKTSGSYGGYTLTVESGDGDFLTADTLWDFKVSKSKPTSKHTLQLLMYWIMGKHSGKSIFNNITKLGIFNPRLNIVYLLDIKNISEDIIKAVEDNVICY